MSNRVFRALTGTVFSTFPLVLALALAQPAAQAAPREVEVLRYDSSQAAEFKDAVDEAAAARLAAPGTYMRMAVPIPGSELMLTWPPDCFMKPYTMLSPSPEPCPTSLVVKNGSKARASTSGAMPVPLSTTSMTT